MENDKNVPQNIADIPNICVAYNLRKVSRQVTKFYQERIKVAGLEGTQFPLLLAIKLNQPISITALANILHIDRTTLSRNLKVLEKNRHIFMGYQDKDNRQKTVALTAQGLELFDTTFPLWQKAQDDIVNKFGKKKWTEMLELLDQISNIAK